MTIVMKKKIDIYLKDPAFFQLDLLNQMRIWMTNVVLPLGSHYEYSKRQVDTVVQIANMNKAEQEQRLARIAMFNDIVIAILLGGVDIIAASALKDVALLSKKFNSQKDLDSFLASSTNFESAFRSFNAQKPKIVDNIVGNIDDKLKGLASTGTGQSVISGISAMVKKIETDVPNVNASRWAGPMKYQNDLESFYTKVCTSINEAFVALVRDANSPPAFKRVVVEHLVNMPFMMPPTLSLESFETVFANYFELCYWCQMISDLAANKEGFGLTDGFLADVVNQRFLAMTGHVITHTGGQKIAAGNISNKFASGVSLSDIRSGDIRMVWDGYCSIAQAKYAMTAIKDAKAAFIDPLFLGQGISCQQAYI